MRCLGLSLRPLRLGLSQRALLGRVALGQCLRLGLVLLLKLLHVGACRRLLGGTFVIGGLFLMQVLPLLLLTITQLILFLLIYFVALDIARIAYRLVNHRG